jgi:hypothetical protein
VFTDLSEYDVVKFIGGQIPDISKAPTFREYFNRATERQFSTILLILIVVSGWQVFSELT